jgi:dimethylamine corrinoid protein
MQVNQEELFQRLSAAVVAMNEEKTVEIARMVIANHMDAYEAIQKGLSRGMEKAGHLFEEGEYFVPELLTCSDAMYAGLDILRPHIKTTQEGKKHRVVIGVVEGDTHDIGKNLVKIMLEASGFEVYDLGRDIPPSQFVDKAQEVKADIIALSTLMTTAMGRMSDVIHLLKGESIRELFKVVVGGGPISQAFADHIGADGYAANSGGAARLARRLVNSGSGGSANRLIRP